MSLRLVAALAAAAVSLAACSPATQSPAPTTVAVSTAPTAGGPSTAPKALASTTWLADIAQNVAGDRLAVAALLPIGADPHSFQPTPADLRKVADHDILIVNGAGFEAWMRKLLENAGGERTLIEASAGLPSRRGKPGEPAPDEASAGNPDPHYFLDPIAVQTYVDNIAAALSTADPDGAAVYTDNAAAYKAQLGTLDRELREILATVPDPNRLLVTDHDDMGYFADRYDLKVVGMVLPSFSSDAAPSAQELAGLVTAIKALGAKAVFTEAGANPKLAQQVATEAGVPLVSDLYTHSLSDSKGPAATYLDMLRHNARVVARSLSGR